MSTFNGIVPEFPDIRIDFFRRQSSTSTAFTSDSKVSTNTTSLSVVRPPLACFLSHAHSDHLAGLESLRSPFVYCSAATREILLRLERYPCRVDYAKGVLEARQQTFGHLRRVLKPLPLDTPTCLELSPGNEIQVTLLDANHCPGSVMFLIEGNDKAILYTGDTRSEPWFVNSLCRNPNVIAYLATSGLKTLDKIYLDTSYTNKDVEFETQAQGIAELLRKVGECSDDTVFYFHPRTYGYENVWIALSRALKSSIHVDEYKHRIYKSLHVKSSDSVRFPSSTHLCPQAAALVGYMCGNAPHPGCLTSDTKVRLHSCDRVNMCSVAKGENVVRIQPVVAHLPVEKGGDLQEVGVGGGGDDLEREAELDLFTEQDMQMFLTRISSLKSTDTDTQTKLTQYLSNLRAQGRNMSLNIDISAIHGPTPATVEQLLEILTKRMDKKNSPAKDVDVPSVSNISQPIMTFSFARHSSYAELCHLVDIFKPRDVWPCTVRTEEWIRQGISIESLFGDYCSGNGPFEHDLKTDLLRHEYPNLDDDEDIRSTQELEHWTATVQDSCNGEDNDDDVVVTKGTHPEEAEKNITQSETFIDLTLDEDAPSHPSTSNLGKSHKRPFDEYTQDNDKPAKPQEEDKEEQEQGQGSDSQMTEVSTTSYLSTRYSITRQDSYNQIIAGDGWADISLISTSGHHSMMDPEL